MGRRLNTNGRMMKNPARSGFFVGIRNKWLI